MDKKSFIRGFGVGVLFAAVILGISFLIRTSDSFVTMRAKELGMVYADDSQSSMNLVSAAPTASAQPTAAKKETPKETAASKSTQAPKAANSATESPKESDNTDSKKETTSSKKTKSMEEEKKELEKSIREEEKKLTIDVGDWSSDVSKKLENLGIVDSAKEFDSYLDKHGYSASINAGTYDVSVNDTYDELARKITGK